MLMFEYLLDQPLPGCSRKEEGAAMSSSQTLRQVLLDEGFRVNSSSDQTDVVFIKELIMGCPIGQQHLSECDPTVSPTYYTNCSKCIDVPVFQKYQFSGRSRDKWFLYEVTHLPLVYKVLQLLQDCSCAFVDCGQQIHWR